MKKTLLLLILSISLAFCLTACKKTPDFTPDPTPEHTHQFGEWITAKVPTSTEEGLSERVCTCGEKETKTIGKLPEGTSAGLEYSLDDDGESYVVTRIGICTDEEVVIPFGRAARYGHRRFCV